MSNHLIVGCGGIGGWVVPLLLKMKPKEDRIILMDGDTVEVKNFDRQLFQPEHIGFNKAEALASTYGISDFLPKYLQKVTRPELESGDWIWCCVDNHPARLECLNWVDELYANIQVCKDVALLIGGNEYEYGEAYFYRSIWRNGELDPRVKFPEILTDKGGDPARPSCTGQAQTENPQLALFNLLAAAAMVHLWYFQMNWAAKIDVDKWPISHSMNHTKMQTFVSPTVADFIETNLT